MVKVNNSQRQQRARRGHITVFTLSRCHVGADQPSPTFTDRLTDKAPVRSAEGENVKAQSQTPGYLTSQTEVPVISSSAV